MANDNARASNGLFTAHLISAIREPRLTLDGVFNRVREEVFADSNGEQIPWTVERHRRVSASFEQFCFRAENRTKWGDQPGTAGNKACGSSPYGDRGPTRV